MVWVIYAELLMLKILMVDMLGIGITMFIYLLRIIRLLIIVP